MNHSRRAGVVVTPPRALPSSFPRMRESSLDPRPVSSAGQAFRRGDRRRRVKISRGSLRSVNGIAQRTRQRSQLNLERGPARLPARDLQRTIGMRGRSEHGYFAAASPRAFAGL